MSTLVGALGSQTSALVDERGVISPRGTAMELAVWVSNDETWHDPRSDPTLRFQLRDAAPVVETRMRLGVGDVVQRTFGVADAGGAVVVELSNESPAAVAVALVAQPTTSSARVLEASDQHVALDGNVHVWSASPARRWLAAPTEDSLRSGVEAGRAATRPILAGGHDSRHLALLFAVPHGVTWRSAIAAGRRGAEAVERHVDPRRLPSAAAVARGWSTALDRGLRVELPDRRVEDAVTVARAQAAIAAQFAGRNDSDLAATLEDWGFDIEAERVWSGLGLAARRRARRRNVARDPWSRIQNLSASPDASSSTALLGAVRSLMIDDTNRDVAIVLPSFPQVWLGADLAAHAAPTRRGPVSFALRWHGDRPALLWDAPRGLQLRAPALDPAWQGAGGRGEALLASPTPELLQLRTSDGLAGTKIDDPGSFS